MTAGYYWLDSATLASESRFSQLLSRTGTAQPVKIREAVRGIEFPVYDQRQLYRAAHVAKAACDHKILSLQELIDSSADVSEQREACNTKRNLLYVACIRARDYLLVTVIDPASEFLDEFDKAAGKRCTT